MGEQHHEEESLYEEIKDGCDEKSEMNAGTV